MDTATEFTERFQIARTEKQGIWIWDKQEKVNVAMRAKSLEEALMQGMNSLAFSASLKQEKIDERLIPLEKAVADFTDSLEKVFSDEF